MSSGLHEGKVRTKTSGQDSRPDYKKGGCLENGDGVASLTLGQEIEGRVSHPFTKSFIRDTIDEGLTDL